MNNPPRSLWTSLNMIFFIFERRVEKDFMLASWTCKCVFYVHLLGASEWSDFIISLFLFLLMLMMKENKTHEDSQKWMDVMLFYVSPEHENFTTENAKAERRSKRGQSLIEAIISHLNEIKFWFIPFSLNVSFLPFRLIRSTKSHKARSSPNAN